VKTHIDGVKWDSVLPASALRSEPRVPQPLFREAGPGAELGATMRGAGVSHALFGEQLSVFQFP
jgi:hypothetical protein